MYIYIIGIISDRASLSLPPPPHHHAITTTTAIITDTNSKPSVNSPPVSYRPRPALLRYHSAAAAYSTIILTRVRKSYPFINLATPAIGPRTCLSTTTPHRYSTRSPWYPFRPCVT